MKNILLLIFSVFGTLSLFAQITPNGNSGSSITAYTNGSPNDPIYIWCAEGLSNNTASLTATPASGTGPWTFNWYYHNQINSSWASYSTTNGATSTITNLPSDSYRVEIYDNGGVLVGCYTALVWNMNGQVTASNSPSACNGSNLTGTIATNGSFTYYNPPPPEAFITASTQINVCFSATHTFVSDLAFYLVGPASCGSPRILLSPNPGSNGQGLYCNGGNNVSNLCFSSTSSNILNVCTASVPLTGTYGGYGAGAGTMINWSALYGCNAAQGGYGVQIYDCIGADVGSLTNATISFSNLTSVCGSPTSLSYTSGALNSPINDNSCSASSASLFQVPVSPLLSTPITINASTSYLWIASPATAIPNSSSSLTPAVANIPNGTTTFTLTATVSYGGTSCTYDAQTAFVNTCCSAVANAGPDASFCTSGNAQLGTAAVANMTYSWSPTTGLNDATLAQPTVTLTNSTGAPVTTIYTLTVTDVLNGSCTSTDEIIITVSAPPTLVISPNTSICVGECVALDVSGADFYNWSPATGISNTALTSQNVCPQNTTTYSVEGYVIGGSAMVNGDFEAGATGFTSDYTLNSDTQSESTYFVTTNANLTHPGFTGVDHTTGTGNFLVVNGSSTPNSSVWCQTVTVQPNTDYVFSTWVSTLAVGSPAILQFSINGTNLSTPFTAPAGTGTWIEFFTTWNSGAATSASICVINQNTSLGGNDFGLDDISFSAVCSSTASVTVTVNPLPSINGGTDQTVCIGSNTTLNGSGGVSYTWNNGEIDGQPFLPPLGSTTFTVTGTDGNGCINTDQVVVTVINYPIADVSADVYSGSPTLVVNFTNSSTNANSYIWNFGNGSNATSTNTNGFLSTYTEPGTYQVVLISSNGFCSDSDTLTIIVIPLQVPILHVPNVFTPNGDGANDYFFIENQHVATISIVVLNRWGNVVFETDDLLGKWDGKFNGNDATEGVYFFKYTAKGINDKEIEGHGNVTLIR